MRCLADYNHHVPGRLHGTQDRLLRFCIVFLSVYCGEGTEWLFDEVMPVITANILRRYAVILECLRTTEYSREVVK
jgi:hypothetical protein